MTKKYKRAILIVTTAQQWYKGHKYIPYNKYKSINMYKNISMVEDLDTLCLNSISTIPVYDNIHFDIEPFSFKICSNHIEIEIGYDLCKPIQILNLKYASKYVLTMVNLINSRIIGETEFKEICFSENGKIKQYFIDLKKMNDDISKNGVS